MTVRWTFKRVVNSVFGRTVFPGKCMIAVHVGPDGHDKIAPGEGCNECGWINLDFRPHSRRRNRNRS